MVPGQSSRRRLFVTQALDGAWRERFPTLWSDVPEPPQDHLGQPLAAPAGEWKGFHDHRTDLAFDIVAQHGAGAVQPGFHGLRLQSENLRGLLDRHPLDDAGDQTDAERFGEYVDLALAD